MSFLDFWSVFANRPKQTELQLKAQHLERLLNDDGIRSALPCDSVLPLLPPVGSAVFRPLTAQSLTDMQLRAQPTCPSPSCKKGAGTELPKPSHHLEDNKPLPFFYGDPPPEILYNPIEELDPFYQSEKTFLVLSMGNILHRFNAESSCYLLSPLSRLRRLSLKILLHPFFTWFILATLLINCVFMVLKNTTANYAMECVFTVIYTCEVLIKVLSRGFCEGRFSFIRDPWNWLDLIVIITAYPALICDMGQFYVLVIIPRVLKIFSVCPGLRRTIHDLLLVAKRLSDVLLLTLFCLSMMAAIGMLLFMGSLRQKCIFLPMRNSYYDNDTYSSTNDTFDFTSFVNDASNQYIPMGSLDPLLCGNASSAGSCPNESVCLRVGKAPNYGYTSYDWFGPSLLSMVRLLTQDFSDNLMKLTIRAEGFSTGFVFILIFLPTCFMLLSQLVAAIVMALVEREEANFAQRMQSEAEFRQIEQQLKSIVDSEEGALPEKKQSSEEEGVATEVKDGSGRLSSCWQLLKQRLQTFVCSALFEWAIIICLVINIIMMATEHYPLTPEHEQLLEASNEFFLVVFLVEMVLKLLALGVKGYFKVSWHIFDFILVLLNLVDTMLFDIEGLSVLRIGRLLRILRLARWWPGFHLFLHVVWSAVRNLTLVLLFLVFLLVVVGLQLFGVDYEENVCHISENCELPRWHTNDLFHTFMLVCRILYGQWIETMWDCMEVSSAGLCVLYYMGVLILGKLLVLVLFLKLLLSSFTNQRLLAVEEKEKKYHQGCVNLIGTLKQLCRRNGNKDSVDHGNDDMKDKKKEFLTLNLLGTRAENKRNEGDKEQEAVPEDCCWDCCPPLCPFQNHNAWSKVRRNSLKIVRNKIFQGFFIFIILLSSAALMLEDDDLHHSPVLKDVLDWADRGFVVLFVIEMILQWFALGFKQYFSNVWCWIDFIVLDVSLVSMVLDLLGLSCRPLRVFRVLRTFSRFDGVRLILQTLVLSLPVLLNTLLVVLVVSLLWALLGVNLFAGKFWFCYNMTSNEIMHPSYVANKSSCFMLMEMEGNESELIWRNADFHFDSVFMGYLSLSIMAMSGGWMNILYSAMDSTWVELQVEYEFNIYAFFYVLGFFISVFFIFNFFIRSFIRVIGQHRHKFGGNCLFMTEDQQMFAKGFKKRFSVKPENHAPRPQNCFQARLFDLVLSEVFEIFMMVVVLLNLVLVMVETEQDSGEKYRILNWLHMAFILVFLLEFLLKIVALRRFYFTGQNVVDLLVLLLSIVGVFIQDFIAFHFIYPTFFLFFRLGRLGRVLRFCHCLRGIRTLLLGFMMSLPALFNVGLLLLILFFTFSVIGMMSFGYLGSDDMFNFGTFWQSVSCMTMVTTSSSWEEFLFPLDFGTDPDSGDFGSFVGEALFLPYLLLLTLLMLPLFIAVIQQTFNAQKEPRELKKEDLQTFLETWRKFDKENTQSIPHSDLWALCEALHHNLRVPTVSLFTPIHTELQGDQLQYEDVLHVLAEQVFDASLENQQLRESVNESFPLEEKVGDKDDKSGDQNE